MAASTLDQEQSTKINKAIGEVLGQHNYQKAFQSSSSEAAAAFGTLMLAGIQPVLISRPTTGGSKEVLQAPNVTPEALATKDFWDFAGRVLGTGIPLLVGALSKDFKQPTAEEIFAAAPPTLRNDKDFWTFLESALNTVVPVVVNAVNGKDYQAVEAPPLPQGKDKGWFDDALSVFVKVAPIVVAAVL